MKSRKTSSVKFICEKSFGHNSNMKNHVNTVHKNVKTNICDFCLKAFTHKCEMGMHIIRVHQNQKNFLSPVQTNLWITTLNETLVVSLLWINMLLEFLSKIAMSTFCATVSCKL